MRNVVFLISLLSRHAHSGTQELIQAYALMCKPNEAGKRARPTEIVVDDEVLPEAKMSNVSEMQPTQRQKSNCVCM